MRTKEQIEEEIKALEACKSYIPRRTAFGEDNHRNVDLQIEFLRGEIDISDNDQWNEFSEREQSAILDAESWRDEQSDEGLAAGWDDYKPRVTAGVTKKAKS